MPNWRFRLAPNYTWLRPQCGRSHRRCHDCVECEDKGESVHSNSSSLLSTRTISIIAIVIIIHNIWTIIESHVTLSSFRPFSISCLSVVIKITSRNGKVFPILYDGVFLASRSSQPRHSCIDRQRNATYSFPSCLIVLLIWPCTFTIAFFWQVCQSQSEGRDNRTGTLQLLKLVSVRLCELANLNCPLVIFFLSHFLLFYGWCFCRLDR